MQIKLSVKERTLLFCFHSQKVEVALEEVEEEGVEEGQAQGRGQTTWMQLMLLDPVGREQREGTALRQMSLLSAGMLLTSLTTNVVNEELGCLTQKGHPGGTLVHHGSVWDNLGHREDSP